METGYGVKLQAADGPANVDDEGGRTILVASDGNGGVTLTDSENGDNESTFLLKNTTTTPESVTYKCTSQNFQISFTGTVPVTLSGPGTCIFQGAQQSDGSWQLALQARAESGLGSSTVPGKSYTYNISLLSTGESHDPTVDIEC